MVIDEELIAAVRKQKALAHRNRSAKNWILFISLTLGGLAWGVWYFMSPAPTTTLKGRAGICILASCIGHYFFFAIHGKTIITREAACPQCGHSWEIKEGRGVPPTEIMTNWDKCPGCGILMNEALLRRQLKSTTKSSTLKM